MKLLYIGQACLRNAVDNIISKHAIFVCFPAAVKFTNAVPTNIHSCTAIK
jgi:hypothetical protein